MKKNIIVTGAGKGIGKSIATRLSKKHNVLLTSRTKTDLVSLKKKLSENQNKVEFLAANINKESNRKRLFEFAKSNFSSIDVLINNAGIYYKKNILKADMAKVDDLMNTNISSMIKLTKLFIPEFITNKSGQIINISSTAGLEGYQGDTIYCASKFAVTGFTKALFEDLRQFNIRVSCVYPDFVNTWGASNSRALLKPENIATVVDLIIDLPDYVVVQDLRITAIEEFQQKLD